MKNNNTINLEPIKRGKLEKIHEIFKILNKNYIDKKISVVYKENTLGLLYQHPYDYEADRFQLEVLTGKLSDGGLNWKDGTISLIIEENDKHIRLATKEDFKDFRIHSEGYYIYDKEFENYIYGFNIDKKNYYRQIYNFYPNIDFKEIDKKFFEDNSYKIPALIDIKSHFFDTDSPNLIKTTIPANFYIINEFIEKVTIFNEKNKEIEISLESVINYKLNKNKIDIKKIPDMYRYLPKVIKENIFFKNPNVDGKYNLQDIVFNNRIIGTLKTNYSGFAEGYEKNYIIPILDNEENKKMVIDNKIDYNISEDKGYIDLKFKSIEDLILYLNYKITIPQNRNEYKIDLFFDLNNESLLETTETIKKDFKIKVNIDRNNNIGTFVGKKENLFNFLKNYCQFTNIQIKGINPLLLLKEQKKEKDLLIENNI